MNDHKVDFIIEKDVLGLDKNNLRFINSQRKNKQKNKDYSSVYHMPSLKRRYASSLIDVCAIVLITLSFLYLYEVIENVPDLIRTITFFLVVFLYEPILISTGFTFGQLLTNIRIRKINNPDEKVGFFAACLRFTVKVLLGWISFFTITFNKNRRGIHDFVSSTIVLSLDEM